MAFFVGIPIIALRPSKFALCFSLGSLMYMGSFSLLKGPWAHATSMVTVERLPFTIFYLGSLWATLYAALVVRSYVMVVASSSLQLCTLAYYMFSFIPGGTAGAKMFTSMVFRTARLTISASVTILKGCYKMVSS